MDSPESGGIGEWARYVASAIVGGAVMLVGIMRAWGGISRKAEDAVALGRANHDRLNFTDGRLNALERAESAATARFNALLDNNERLERKVDRLLERLGG